MAVMYDWVQGWVVVLAVGIAAGIVAGGSDIASQWLGDIKEGYCDTAFYLNKNFCCWGLEGKHAPIYLYRLGPERRIKANSTLSIVQ